MKTIYLFLMLLLTVSVQSQQNSKTNDIIVLSNGQLIQAQVTRVSADAISFQYPGETVQNEIKVGQLEKIVFASGRTQEFSTNGENSNDTFNDRNPNATIASRPSKNANEVSTKINETLGTYKSDEVYLLPDYAKNSVTVLPFNFIENGDYNSELAGESTNYATNYLSQKSSTYGIKVQDINTTVRQLMNAQIDLDGLSATPVKKLFEVLNTEYIIKVNIQETSSSAPKVDEKLSLQGYFGKKPTRATKKPAAADGDGVNITYEVYRADKNKSVYSMILSENRKPLTQSEVATTLPQWKFALTYVINGFLSTQK